MAPIGLHPENPHYFLFRGKPTVLVTSGEHYGAVLNPDFDYVPYLDELRRCGFNLTRTFSGVYREVPGSFKIEDNTLAPDPARFLCPWARSAEPGNLGGGHRFDLRRWDGTYFARLKDFLDQAERRGIVIELVLFCPMYGPELWAASPMNAANNVNGVGNVTMDEPYTLRHTDLVAVQEAMVRRIAEELNRFDNLYYEICNEPYIKSLHPKTGHVADDWQEHIAAVLIDAESRLPQQHLLAQNIANKSCLVERPNPNISIFNFHYSAPPDSVAMNLHLARPVAFDESGFQGRDDAPYRCDGWDFLLAGGAVYSHLDYSFTAKHPDGTFNFTTSPSGGGPTLRRQLSILKEFIESLDFVHMAPDNSVIRGGVPEDATARALVEPGKACAVYLRGGRQADLTLSLPRGQWQAEWLNPRTGEVEKIERFNHAGSNVMLRSPPYSEDTALRILALSA